jgi:hypothetical protein
MTEILRTNDAVLISAIEALLRSAGFDPYLADQHMSVLDGSLGILPRRLLVLTEDADAARRLLTEAGFGEELRPA